jgi:mRNA interferase RelE/StbE
VQGAPGLLRIRVGDYRIIYSVNDGELLILVIDIGHRSSIYRNI